MTYLKPCPFCGGTNIIYTDEADGKANTHCVYCNDCGGGTANFSGCSSHEKLKNIHIDVIKEVNKMPKREVICSQHLCLSCPLSVRVTGKDCRQLTQIEIDKILYAKYKVNISNNTIKYCYKADNYYDFERRLYFLSLIIEKKFIKGLNTHEAKKA